MAASSSTIKAQEAARQFQDDRQRELNAKQEKVLTSTLLKQIVPTYSVFKCNAHKSIYLHDNLMDPCITIKVDLFFLPLSLTFDALL